MNRTAILMPVYEPDPDALSRTMASLRAQTAAADIVIVDDGSARPVRDLVGLEAVVLRLDRNGGITRALNHGLDYIEAQGFEYVARMDCGDLCAPNRIEVQQAYMDRRPEIDLLGAHADVVDEQGRRLFVEGTSGGQDAIRRKIYDNAPFKHPTFFFRVSSLRGLGRYDPAFKNAEDYELMLRFFRRGGRMHCLDEVLLSYESAAGSLSNSRRREQLLFRLRAQLRHFRVLEPRAYLGVARTIVTLLVPARSWSRVSRAYWRGRERRRGISSARS